MARSPFTLVAAVTAALPGADVTGARALTAGGDGRFDSAVATLADGRELVIRVAEDDEAALELAEEAIALRALTSGVREMLPFAVPEYVGETRVGEARALVTDLLPGFQIDAPHVPAGRGAAPSIGAATAAVHALPASVVRGAGLTVRDAADVRREVEQLVDRAAATGRVPARLTARWRDAAGGDALWRFESTVTLGGAQAGSFLFQDDTEHGPQVTGVLGWRGLSVGDPAVDLSWLSAAPDAAEDVHAAYLRASARAVDEALRVRARLHAELEFARWLLHGESLHRPDIVDDAAALLESLAEGLRADDLAVIAAKGAGVDSALEAVGRVPETVAVAVDTSMQTDAYRPEELWSADDPSADTGAVGAADAAGAGSAADGGPADGGSAADAERGTPTQDLTEVTGVRGSSGGGATGAAPSDGAVTGSAGSGDAGPEGLDDEAQRAARAALQRWTSSASDQTRSSRMTRSSDT
ncbi:phosphotransferase [Microbacterium neungamense]|uniref:phosphotransferase n=1 Tax=Microbacterium neungamense TaxID=2810535 RepID=UPI00217D27AF|nr:phosphotransferase [Microbacterium neungamense]UWF78151.1 phosphotransferase [Microbacterium neungamense]